MNNIMTGKEIKSLQSLPLWDFSVQIYTREGVESACLHLQDHFGLNTNFLLFCVWVGYTGRGTLGHSGIHLALASIVHWHGNVVEPLRRIRRMVKTLEKSDDSRVESLRRGLLHNELGAERLEQETLSEAVSLAPRAADRSESDRLNDCLANLAAYLETLGFNADNQSRRHLCTVVQSTFEDLTKAKLTRSCNRYF